MKQEPTLFPLMKKKTTQIILFALLVATISGTIGCKNKDGGHQNLNAEDSAAITKATIAKVEKFYYLRLTKHTQQTIFTNNNVKMIDFKWRLYPGNIWGLDAYGMDSLGNQVTGPFEVEPITSITPLPNYQYLDRIEPQIMLRGDIKFILGLPSLGQNVPIPTADYQDLLMSPTPYPYPETNDVYFEVTVFPNIALEKTKKIATQQGYTNPSPPAKPACDTGCDQESPD